MHTIEHHCGRQIDYSLYRSLEFSDQLIAFMPGMAANRFGHHTHKEPQYAIRNLVELTAKSHDVLFPDVHSMDKSDAGEHELKGLAIEQQNDNLLSAIEDNGKEYSRITFVAQSLGCLAIAALAGNGLVQKGTSAIFLSPPTYEGIEHRLQIISKFSGRKETFVDEEGSGQIQLGNGRLMQVTPSFWDSIDNNSIRKHYDAIIDTYKNPVAFCPSHDHFYPNNKTYLSKYASGIRRVEIEGTSHTFKSETMSSNLKLEMQKIFSTASRGDQADDN